MDQQTCPYLGTLDGENRQQPGVDHPSFENHCFADPNLVGNTLLLGDQATYCLFGGCLHCPRFQSAQRFTRPGVAPLSPAGVAPLPTLIYPQEPGPESIDYSILDFEPLDPDLLAVDVERTDQSFDLIDFAVDADADSDGEFDEFDDGYDDDYLGSRSRVSPAWLLAGTLFFGTFLCGSVMFFLVSFQAVRGNLGNFFSGSPSQGQVYAVAPAQQNLAAGQAVAVPENGSNSSIVLVVTATSEPVDEPASGADVSGQPESQPDSTIEEAAEKVAVAVDDDGKLADEASARDDVETVSKDMDELALMAPTPTIATIDFPKAVTPTTIVVVLDDLDGNDSGSDNSGAVDAADVSAPDEANGEAPRFIPVPTSTPVPEINVNLLVPTPPDGPPEPDANNEPLIDQVNEIAAQPSELVEEKPNEDEKEEEEDDEPAEDEPEKPTPTPTATWPAPLVLFGAKDEVLMAGECTEIFWTVENVRAVYVENIPMNGSGEREECIRDVGETFVLTVVLPDGSTENHTVTVNLLPPTATPTATPTFTPVPIPTPTWTPIPPSPTPTPAFVYGVSLAAAGTSMSCSAGTTCELGLTVKNIGNVTDNLAVYVEQGGEWLPTLCNAVGNCAVDRLVIAGVGEANTAGLTLKFDIPAGSPPRAESYRFRASSEGSGGAARSDAVTIEVNVP